LARPHSRHTQHAPLQFFFRHRPYDLARSLQSVAALHTASAGHHRGTCPYISCSSGSAAERSSGSSSARSRSLAPDVCLLLANNQALPPQSALDFVVAGNCSLLYGSNITFSVQILDGERW